MELLLDWNQFNEGLTWLNRVKKLNEDNYSGPRGSQPKDPYLDVAMDRTTRAINSFTGNNYMFKQLAYKLDIVYLNDPGVPRAATDGTRILINPKFWASLSVTQAKFVLAHEILHCALLHFDRVLDRNALQWNIATDYEIDLLLVNNNMITIDEILQIGGLVSEKYKGMGAEEIYKLPEIAADAARLRAGDPDDKEEGEDEDDGEGNVTGDLAVGDVIQDDITGQYGRVKSIDGDKIEYEPISEKDAIGEFEL